MKILITGIAGQLGNRLSELLIERGISHKGISRSKTYVPNEGVSYYDMDLSDIETLHLKIWLSDITHVIHFADVISDSTDYENDLLDQFQNCCINTIKLINCLPDTIEHFSFGSSVAVYGTPTQLPILESTETIPQNIYGYTKLVTEIYLKSIKCNFPISILRIGSIYGPGPKNINQYRAVPNIINTVLQNKNPYVVADGATYRDYMYIDDCLNACINASLKKASGIFNIATGKGTSIKEIADTVISISKKDLTLEHDFEKDIEWSAVCDVTKMKNELNYQPKFSIDSGLSLTYKWHKELGYLQ
tara:strand:- start:5153 stop:6064 length:912 start_codon:yes stop_codon:yes gene_type:complete